MKFAQVGYGHDGRADGATGLGYTYVVNDNIRKGQKIMPVVRHYKSGNIFITEGQVLSVSKNLGGYRNNTKAIREDLSDKFGIQLDSKGNFAITGRAEALKTENGDPLTQLADTAPVHKQDNESGKFVNSQAERQFVNAQQSAKDLQNVTGANFSANTETKLGMTYEEYAKAFKDNKGDY